MEAPIINVGIMTHKAVSFSFNEEYVHTESGMFITGEQRALWVNGKIVYNGHLYQELFFEPSGPEASFDLKAVTIGVDFHWQREENQRFKGALNLVSTEEGIVVINQVDAEDYLTSVISSEMSANASKELLKAHAVISRSWLLAQIEKKLNPDESQAYLEQRIENEEEVIRWYDRENHELFDVCADDHCQRYQGILRTSNPIVEIVMKETRGEVLSHDGRICDTRFSKCCGGVTERFENCWEPVPHAYLTAVRDAEANSCPDLTDEREAERWIRSKPEAFCSVDDPEILNQALNNYDLETADFYRWRVDYSQEELSGLIRRKTGRDLGAIIDLIPLERGSSGRIIRLKIVGERATFTVGKELEIRRTLSESHLYSSAFVVDKEEVHQGIPGKFSLIGAGWGHGVGLCQIGAAMMAAKGYSYREILSHYFPGAVLEKRY